MALFDPKKRPKLPQNLVINGRSTPQQPEICLEIPFFTWKNQELNQTEKNDTQTLDSPPYRSLFKFWKISNSRNLAKIPLDGGENSGFFSETLKNDDFSELTLASKWPPRS